MKTIELIAFVILGVTLVSLYFNWTSMHKLGSLVYEVVEEPAAAPAPSRVGHQQHRHHQQQQQQQQPQHPFQQPYPLQRLPGPPNMNPSIGMNRRKQETLYSEMEDREQPGARTGNMSQLQSQPRLQQRQQQQQQQPLSSFLQRPAITPSSQ